MKPEVAKDKPKKKRLKGFQVVENECIWLKAGVVNFHICDNAFDCYNCPFSKGMSKAMNTESPAKANNERPEWVQHLQKRYNGASRPCRHALTGRVDAPKICTRNYECYHCEYDQMLDEFDLGELTEALNYKVVSGYRMAYGYYYHMGHSWARFEHGGRVRVGFDDFLVKVFGASQALNLPPLGASLRQDQVGWSFGRNDHKAAVLSPVTGTVLAVNHKALDYPELTNVDPYNEGWLFILEPDLPKRNLKRLYFEKEGFQWMEQEVQKLTGLMGLDNEQLAHTGGEAINDLYGQFPGLEWDGLVRTFLRTETV